MNNAARKPNPPSRMSKDELKDQNEALKREADTLGLENQRLLQQLEEMRRQQADADGSSDVADVDPVTGRPLRPALSEEELAAQDEELARQYAEQMGDDKADVPVHAVQTNRRPSMARNNVSIIRPSMETDERDTGHHGLVNQFLDTPAGEDPKLVEHARSDDMIAAKKKQDNLAFMRQMVTIHIMQAQRPDEDQMFSIGINGRQWHFERNTEYTVPRYVVEGLLRAKPMTYGNVEYTRQDGVRDVKWPIQQGVRYPFAIVHDKYPHWREWMAFTMKQPD